MSEKGYPKDLEQCRTRIKTKKKEYKIVKDSSGENGRGRRTCRYYDMLDSVLCHRPASVPHNLLDSHSEVEEPAESERNGMATLSITCQLSDIFVFQMSVQNHLSLSKLLEMTRRRFPQY